MLFSGEIGNKHALVGKSEGILDAKIICKDSIKREIYEHSYTELDTGIRIPISYWR